MERLSNQWIEVDQYYEDIVVTLFRQDRRFIWKDHSEVKRYCAQCAFCSSVFSLWLIISNAEHEMKIWRRCSLAEVIIIIHVTFATDWTQTHDSVTYPITSEFIVHSIRLHTASRASPRATSVYKRKNNNTVYGNEEHMIVIFRFITFVRIGHSSCTDGHGSIRMQ